jgi:hypothetical protein
MLHDVHFCDVASSHTLHTPASDEEDEETATEDEDEDERDDDSMLDGD